VESISQFRRKVQTDAQEFLSFFLDTVHNELTVSFLCVFINNIEYVQQQNKPSSFADSGSTGH